MRRFFTWDDKNWPSFRIVWALWTEKGDHEDFDTGHVHEGCVQRRVFYFFWRRRPRDGKNFFQYGQALKCEANYDRLILRNYRKEAL